MSLGWIILGTICQAGLGLLLFMLAAFAGGGLASGGQLRPRQLRVLDAALLILPGSCAVVSILVLILYFCAAGPAAYWLYVVPLALSALYILYVQWLGRHAPDK